MGIVGLGNLGIGDLGKIVQIHEQNLKETLNISNFLNHDASSDHGPAVTVLGLDLFQTNGLGEDINAGATDGYHAPGAGGFLGDIGFDVGSIVGDLFHT